MNDLTQMMQAANSVLVVLDKSANYDQIASGLSLWQGLLSLGKTARVVAAEAPSGIDNLSDKDQIGEEVGSQSLTISFDYSEEKVDKISYHISEETSKFLLTIKPQQGAEPLDPSTVEYSHVGADADLIVTIGVNQLEDLEHLYFGYEQLFRDASVISIHNHAPEFTTYVIDTGSASSTAEKVFELMEQLGISWTTDMASNLLAGLEWATKNFTAKNTAAAAFAAAAKLLQFGARRPPIFSQPKLETTEIKPKIIKKSNKNSKIK